MQGDTEENSETVCLEDDSSFVVFCCQDEKCLKKTPAFGDIEGLLQHFKETGHKEFEALKTLHDFSSDSKLFRDVKVKISVEEGLKAIGHLPRTTKRRETLLKCKMCEFRTQNMARLEDHMVKEHKKKSKHLLEFEMVPC